MGNTKLILTLFVFAVIAATYATGEAETAVDDASYMDDLREVAPDSNNDMRELTDDQDTDLTDEDAKNLARIMALLAEKDAPSTSESSDEKRKRNLVKRRKGKGWKKFIAWVKETIPKIIRVAQAL